MRDQSAITSSTSSSSPIPRPRLRARCQAFCAERRDGIMALVFTLTITGILSGYAGFATYSIKMHNARTQAVARAQKMDGKTYTIKGVGWNFVGDTRLYLENERGEDAGWVMIYMNNPLTTKVNPLCLAFSDKRDEPLPFPMKVRAHYRQEPWVEEPTGERRENYTGSFLAFEQVDPE